MNRSVFIVLFLALLAACGSQPAENMAPRASSNSNAAPIAPMAGNTSNAVANANSAAPLKGERITSPTGIKFEGPEFPAGWTWVDPDAAAALSKHTFESGVLKIDVPPGKDLFGENRTAPRLLKAVDGDFEIETRVKFDPKHDYQGAGIVIYSGPEMYLRLERSFGGTGGSGNGIRLDVRTPTAYTPVTTPEDAPTEANTVDLKILRVGKTIAAFWRLNEDSEWREVGEYEANYPASVQVGIIACNTAAAIPVEFSYIRLAPPQS